MQLKEWNIALNSVVLNLPTKSTGTPPHMADVLASIADVSIFSMSNSAISRENDSDIPRPLCPCSGIAALRLSPRDQAAAARRGGAMLRRARDSWWRS